MRERLKNKNITTLDAGIRELETLGLKTKYDLFSIASVADDEKKFDKSWAENRLSVVINQQRMESRFIALLRGEVSEFPPELMNGKNIALVCSTAKTVFCIFVASFGNFSNPKDPHSVLVLSGQGKLMYPEESQKSTNSKASQANKFGSLSFGNDELVITKSLQVTASNKDEDKSYFGKLDKEALFGISSNEEEFKLELI
jgi:hypothetical protein